MTPGTGHDATVLQRAVVWTHVASIQLRRAYDALEDMVERDDATYGDWWLSDANVHYTLLALSHVVKACDLESRLPQHDESQLLTLLRNFREHWEDPDGRSGRALDGLRPGHREEPIAFMLGELWFYGVESAEIQVWLRDVDRAARAALESLGEPAPARDAQIR